MLFLMDVKSDFLNGDIQALYGLKQAPRVWYEHLSSFLIQNGFSRGKLDTTLFYKNLNNDFIIVQIYINDIIFFSTNESLCKCEFEMRMMSELKFFLSLQIRQESNAIFIHQMK